MVKFAANVLVSTALLCVSLSTQAAVLLVDKQSVDCDDVSGAPFCRIQPAVDAAQSGDIVDVAAGTYFGPVGAEAVVVVPAGKTITLRGAGADSVILRGDDSGRRGIVVEAAAEASISRVSVTGASLSLDSEHGAGVKNLGRLTLSDCTIDRNRTAGNGGGIYSESSLVVERCVISHNISERSDAVSQNSGGGGIYASGQLELRESVLFNNRAAYGGGGVMLDNSAAAGGAVITNSTILRNVAKVGGGILSKIDLTLTHSSILTNAANQNGGGHGGGIAVETAITANVVNSLLYFNQASSGGGGLFHGSSANINIYSSSIINNTTLGGNGGGLYVDKNFGAVVVGNSLISGNRDRGVSATDPVSPDCSGTLQSLGYNLVGNSLNCRLTTAAGDLRSVDARLDIRPTGGGVTQFIHVGLRSDSPAIDRGNPNGCLDYQSNAISVDLAGNRRVIDGDVDGVARCDIGAFEAAAAAPPVFAPAPEEPIPEVPVSTLAVVSGGGGGLGLFLWVLVVAMGRKIGR